MLLYNFMTYIMFYDLPFSYMFVNLSITNKLLAALEYTNSDFNLVEN